MVYPFVFGCLVFCCVAVSVWGVCVCVGCGMCVGVGAWGVMHACVCGGWGCGGGVGGWMGACVHACMCTCSVYICCLYSGHVAKWFKALEHTSDHLSRSNPSLTKTAICRVEGNPDFCRLQTCTLTLNLLSQEAHLAGDLACLQC